MAGQSNGLQNIRKRILLALGDTNGKEMEITYGQLYSHSLAPLSRQRYENFATANNREQSQQTAEAKLYQDGCVVPADKGRQLFPEFNGARSLPVRPYRFRQPAVYRLCVTDADRRHRPRHLIGTPMPTPEFDSSQSREKCFAYNWPQQTPFTRE